MKRPKTSSKKISWFSIASVFLLAIALTIGVASNTQAATGSFDRDVYLPSLGDTTDYDRAVIQVTDSSANTTASQDSITVTIKAGSNAASFVLKETSGSSGIFSTIGGTTTTNTVLPLMYPVGTTSGYIEDFGTGSHAYPALGATIVGLNLLELSGNTGGDATTSPGTDGSLTIASGNTLELLYGGSTLDTAVIKTNSGSFSFSPSSVSAVTTNTLANPNLIISVTDPDENLNPVAKDVIGLSTRAVALSGSPGTGTSRVQIEAIDQTSGSTLTISTLPIVASNIMLVETGNNTGIFSASGKVFGTTTTVGSSNLQGNVVVGSATTFVYAGEVLTMGAADSSQLSVSFRILEANSSGVIGLAFLGSSTVGNAYGTAGVVFKADSNPRSGSYNTTVGTGYGSQSLSVIRDAFLGTASSGAVARAVTGFGATNANYATSSTSLVKLIDGTSYCLLEITRWAGTATAGDTPRNDWPNANAASAAGDLYTHGAGGSITVQLSSFQLVGARSGDTLKVSYLDELTAGGTSGTVTGNVAFGVAGETGTLALDAAAPDINDLAVITVVDGNLNTSSSTKETVGEGTSLWGGTTTDTRGDRLTIKAYSTTGKKISVSHPDGSAVGTQTVRIASTDNTYVWMVPNSLSDAFQSPYSLPGSTTFSLGTQSVDAVPLVRGSSSGANSFLSSASTSSFVATLDGQDNTVEISPDGTRWISVPIVETGANSSTFVGTIGFDYTAIRLTTNTSTLISTLISDFTGTSSLTFPDGDLSGNGLQTFIGTGSVIRIFDGTTQEFAEVCSPAAATLSVTKLANSVAFDPDKTWIQVIGNDMTANRKDTNSAGSVYFRIGGYYGATYRIRYNDGVGASGAYLGGDTLAVTTSNMGFTTYTGSLSTDVTGTSGPDTWIVVTLVDQDLNTNVDDKQTTFEKDSATSNNIFWNENGLGLPSGSSTGNVSRNFKNGGTAKIVYASRVSSILSSSVDLSSGGNTVDFGLVETANNSGTFKGSFRLSSGSTTANADDVLKVTNGDSVYVHYNDSPSASAADNSSSYTTTGPISIVTTLGTLALSKDTAYLSGDTIVATVVDVDRNTSLTTADTLTTVLKVTGANYSVGTDLVLDLIESSVNSGTFLATIHTGTQTTGGSSGTGDNEGTVKAVQDGIANVIYTDTSPSGQSATKTLSFSADNATLAFDADSYKLGTYALVTLTDKERNTSHTVAQSLLSDVFIQTSSANSTKVRMVENGLDTGTFLGSIQVASSGGTTEFTRIQAAEGDTLKITYIDEVNTTGSSRTVTDIATVAAAAATPTPTPAPATPTPTPGPATPTPTPGPATPTPTPGPTPTTGIIQVSVVSSALGQPVPVPIEGATVSVDTAPAGTTGPDGSLVILNVAAGAHTVDVTATGFDSSSQTVTVTAGGVTTATFDLVPAGVVTPTPIVTPTPTVCVPESITAAGLSLKRKQSKDVTVTVNGDTCDVVEGETVTATINAAGKKRISISPTSDSTDASGQATFTITAKKKTGSARVTFKAGSAKKSITVKVRK